MELNSVHMVKIVFILHVGHRFVLIKTVWVMQSQQKVVSISIYRRCFRLKCIPDFYMSEKSALSVLNLSFFLSMLVDWLVNPLSIESVN